MKSSLLGCYRVFEKKMRMVTYFQILKIFLIGHFCRLLNVPEDVRQTVIYTTEALVPEPNAYEARLLLKSFKV
jgi:hypothetical protein